MRITRPPNSLLKALAAGVLAGLLLAAAARRILAAEEAPKAAAPPGSADSRPSVEHPVGWRGDGSGQYPSARPPTKWSARENVLWKAEVGIGSSQPVVVGPRVFVTAEPDLLICVDAETGKELWRRAHKLSDFPAASKSREAPAAERLRRRQSRPGERRQVGLGLLRQRGHGLLRPGRQARWAEWCDFRRTTEYARTASPVLVGDRLLVHFGPLVCLDAATGKVLWKNDSAKATYGTPAAARIGDVDVVITPAGDAVRVADGKLLAADLGRCTYASPVVQGRIVYFLDRSISAVQLPEKAGDQFEGKELWFEDLSGEFFASPIVHGGRIYAVNRSAELLRDRRRDRQDAAQEDARIAARRAQRKPQRLSQPLPRRRSTCSSATTPAKPSLLEPGDDGTAIGLNALPAGSGSTPVFAGQRMFVRGGKLLYCVGER